MRTTRSDAGSAYVLEAVIIATIMVSSIVYVSTLSAPLAAETVRTDLGQRSQDALNIMADLPMNSTQGTNMLSAYLAQCLQQNCANLDNQLHKLLPSGVSYSVSISNGYATFPILANHSPIGEAVTASHLLEPSWSYTFVGTGQNVHQPTRDPLVAYSLPVFDSNVLDQGGSPLRILLHATSAGANITLSSSANTQALLKSGPASPAVSLYFVDPYGNPTGMQDVTNQSVTNAVTPLPTGANLNFRVRMAETANQVVPAGAELHVDMPRAWNATASGPLNAGWTLVASVANATGTQNGTTLIARTNATLRGGSLDFVFNATFQGDTPPDYLFRATLSRGSLAESNLVVRGNTSESSSFAQPVFAISTPRPMGATAPTTWTIGLGMPGSPDVIISSIEIIEQDGRNIFGNATLVSGPASSSVTTSGNRITWTAPPGGTFNPKNLSVVFNVTPSGTVASPTTMRTAFEPPLGVGGSTGRYLQQVAAGLWRQTVLPQNGSYVGYDVNAAPQGATHILASNGSYKGLTMPGTANYTVGTLTVNTSALGSYVGVENRTVTAGSTAVIDIDVQSLLFQLAKAGLNTSLSLNIYPPWSGDTRIPIASSSSFDTALLQSDVVSMTSLDLNGDGYSDPILGTSNGRVLALHALTGGRLEGDVFSAPAIQGAQGSSAPSISLLTTMTLGGSPYVVVGTNQGSIFVLDSTLHQQWSWFYGAGGSNLVASVVSFDVSQDLTGDGRPDIVAGVQVQDPSTSTITNVIYVFSAPVGSSNLVSWPDPNNPIYNPLAPPSALLSLPRIGPGGSQPGFATSYLFTPGVSAPQPPALNTFPPSFLTTMTTLPRSGLRGVQADGNETWLIGGAPVTVARATNWDGDAIPDIVAGEPAGYVVMANGSAPAAPLGSLMLSGPTEIIAATTHDRSHAALLTRDGTALFTVDGWGSTVGIGCVQGNCQLPPGLTGIAQNASGMFWISAPASVLLRSVPANNAGDLVNGLNVTPVTPTVTKDGAGFSIGAGGTMYNFNDVFFRYGDERNTGYAIGTPVTCPVNVNNCLSEDLVIKTQDGGVTWNAVSAHAGNLTDKQGNMVTAPLAHLNFTNDSLGWITGAGGTLLRTLDGGATWKGIDVAGTTTNLSRIACVPQAPDTCVVVGDMGSAWRTTNGTAQYPGWTTMPQVSLQAGVKALSSVGFVNASVGFIGSANLVLETWDGGGNWTALPLAYIPGNGDVVNTLPDGTGYIYGGNVAQARIFQFTHYNMTSHAQTLNLSGPSAANLPAGAIINRVDVQPSESYTKPGTNPAMAMVYYNVSADGGQHWTAVQANTSWTTFNASYHMEWGAAVPDSVNGYTVTPSVAGQDLRLRMNFATSGDMTAMSAIVHGVDLAVNYTANGITGNATYHLDLNTTTMKDPANTDAMWTPGFGGVVQALANSTYWVANVSGAVQDLQVGLNVSGDPRPEIYVATGSVLAANSPDSILYAGNNQGMTVGVDNSVYLLDGRTGAVAAKAGPFDGPVTKLALSDIDGNGVPEILYASISGPSGGELVGLDPTSLHVNWKIALGPGAPSALLAGFVRGPSPVAFAATRSSTTGPTVVPGQAAAYNAADGSPAWTSTPDIQGHYTVTVPIQQNWLFGPYVVEADVDWRTTGYGLDFQSQVPVTVVQTERFYDYFLVTPPGALAPPSPVYNVQLTAWYNDWR